MLGEFLMLQKLFLNIGERLLNIGERPGPKGTSESFPRDHVGMKGRVGVV